MSFSTLIPRKVGIKFRINFIPDGLLGFSVCDNLPFLRIHFVHLGFRISGKQRCDAVCFLPDWKESCGAVYEHDRALALGKRIFFFDEWKDGGIN